MHIPDFRNSVVITGDFHFEKPYVRLNGVTIPKISVFSRFLEFITHSGHPLLLILAGDCFETRTAALERLAQERLEFNGLTGTEEEKKREIDVITKEQAETVEQINQQLQLHDLVDVTIFLPGNHDPLEGLYDLLCSYKVHILPHARIPMQTTTAFIHHGANLGMEQAASENEKQIEQEKSKLEKDKEKKYGTGVLQRTKEKIVSTQRLGIKKEWWMVLGHFSSPVANLDYRVAGFSNWEGNISDQFHRRFIRVDPQEANGVSVVKLPKAWILT